MVKNFNKLNKFLIVCIFLFYIGFGFVGCGNKKYDVTIKIINSDGYTWFFTPDVDELRYEFEYTGEKMRFWIDSWKIPKHPRWGNEWFTPNNIPPNEFHSSYGKVGQMYYEEDPKFICERGEYYYHVYTDYASDLWNYRSIFLYIKVI